MTTPVTAPLLRDSGAFNRYAYALDAWLKSDDGSAGPPPVAELSLHVRANGIAVEHFVATLQASEVLAGEVSGVSPDELRRRDTQYARAVGAAVLACYGHEAELRVLRGTEGGAWIVMRVREGTRWDPEIEMRRQDWLCCATLGDRRYISPVPRDWMSANDADLMVSVLTAPPDLRGMR